jgi:hypothetical protein
MGGHAPHVKQERGAAEPGGMAWLVVLFALIGLLAPVLAQTPSTPPGGLFANEGPTFVYAAKDWTVYVPLVSSKSSGKVGVFVIGEDIFTFPAPRNKVRVAATLADPTCFSA